MTRFALVAAAAVLFVLPARATTDDVYKNLPKMMVVLVERDAQGREIAVTATPVDFDRAVTDEKTAEEVNKLALLSKEAIALSPMDTPNGDVAAEGAENDYADGRGGGGHGGGHGGGFHGGGGFRGGFHGGGGHWGGGYRGGYRGGYGGGRGWGGRGWGGRGWGYGYGGYGYPGYGYYYGGAYYPYNCTWVWYGEPYNQYYCVNPYNN
jgi:hypothetical protein